MQAIENKATESPRQPNPFERVFNRNKTVSDSNSFAVSSEIAEDSSVLERISAYKATVTKGKKQSYSKRIVLGANPDIQTLVCSATGIVYAMLGPAVQGHALLIDSPFSSYSNCRGLVAQGTSYLARLDSQVLSGILLTLSSNYSLFRSQPSDSGAQKNSLLRTVDREVLIDAVIFIERLVNSNNALFIPKLSLILDDLTIQNGLNARMKEWLKVAVDAVYRPDKESYEEAVAIKKTLSVSTVISVSTVSKVKKEAIAARGEFKGWKKDAKEDIAELFSSKLISFKLKSYLIAVLTEENIAAADSAVIGMLCSKLIDLDNKIASDLSKQISYFHKKLAVTTGSDWDDDQPSFASGKVGDSLIDPLKAEADQPINQVKELTFIEKLRLKKAAAKESNNDF